MTPFEKHSDSVAGLVEFLESPPGSPGPTCLALPSHFQRPPPILHPGTPHRLSALPRHAGCRSLPTGAGVTGAQPLLIRLQGATCPELGGLCQARQVPPCWGCSTHLDIFLRFFSSALAFWAEVRLSASARLSTAMARKTLSRISEGIQLRRLGLRMKGNPLGPESHPAHGLAGLNPTPLVGLSESPLPELLHGMAWARGHGRAWLHRGAHDGP